MKSRVLWSIGIVGMLNAIARAPAAQAPAGPAFEVASVKPAPRDLLRQRGLTCGFGAGGRFMGFGNLQWLIACAYGIPPARAEQEISGGPPWLTEDLFVIMANSAPEAVPRSQPEGLVMLRTLLADRFRLAVHRETKTVPTWALVMARRDGRLGPQLRQTSGDCAAWIAGGRRGTPPPLSTDLPCSRGLVSASAIRNSAMTLSQFANLLSPRVERPVQDRTGLSGNFSLDLQWRPEPGTQGSTGPGLADDLPTSIFTALQEQLGLKLESTQGTVDALIIDHVQRPTED